MDGISLELRTEWIDDLEGHEHFGALFFSDPFGVGEPATVEITGGVYSRQEATGLWTRSSPTAITLNTAVVWRALTPGTTVAAVGFMDSAFGTTGLLHRAMLPEPDHFPAGGTWVLPAGEYVAGLDFEG